MRRWSQMNVENLLVDTCHGPYAIVNTVNTPGHIRDRQVAVRVSTGKVDGPAGEKFHQSVLLLSAAICLCLQE